LLAHGSSFLGLLALFGFLRSTGSFFLCKPFVLGFDTL
jgi:hypothetical protein